ncbi:hypothetical protein QYM36_003777 [Artemia franciscana]|uniref:Uncharacterized protein n=1 Tax=Artemia franciscana TaxID=6661 RepID=A0AA88I4D2_ARTSF|nr:hypothetical protein QYM36_003777 [Artemia franciscana]
MAHRVLRIKYGSTKHDIKLFSHPENELAAKIPHIGYNIKTAGPKVEQLEELMKTVELIQREKKGIETQLLKRIENGNQSIEKWCFQLLWVTKIEESTKKKFQIAFCKKPMDQCKSG